MILPVALISVIFLISSSLGSNESCHPPEGEFETIYVQRYFEKCHKKDSELLKCQTEFQNYAHSKQQEVDYLKALIMQQSGEIDLQKDLIRELKEKSELATLTNQFREDIAKLGKIVKIAEMDENNPTKSNNETNNLEVKTGEVLTTPLDNISNQTKSKTQAIDIPDPCPRSQTELKVVREIKLPGSDPFKVACLSHSELGPGWFMIYRKYYNSKKFNRTYEDYERGFGEVGTEFDNEMFIGLNRLYQLMSGKPHEVVLETSPAMSRCDNFVIGDRSEGYAVKSIDNCTGDGVWTTPKQGTKFSTFDHDEDGVPDRNLANEWGHGWWFHPGMSPKGLIIMMYVRRTY